MNRKFPHLDPGDVLSYWDMKDLPDILDVGKYMTTCGEIARIVYVGPHAGADVFGYVGQHPGPSNCCVWTFDGLIRTSWIKDRAWDFSLTCRFNDGIRSPINRQITLDNAALMH